MIGLLTLSLLAQSPEQLRTLFPLQAEVALPGRPGDWARLPLPDAVLREVERDLADVRLIDARGALVPFVVQRERTREDVQRVVLVQRSATRAERPAGEGTPNIFEETAVFDLPASRARTLLLQFNSPVARFVRRATLEALTEAGAVVGRVETTFFRLPGAGEQLEVWLPAVEREVTRVRVTLVGQGDGFITPSVTATFATSAPPERSLEWPLVEAPVQEGSSTVWRLQKPRGIVPMRLAVKTSTPWFNRELKVLGAGGEVLGQGRVFRQAGYTPATRLEVPLGGLTQETLEIRISNEDSPPLEAVSLAFVIEQPELVFTVPQTLPVTAYFGGHRTRPARFDTSGLEVLLPPDLEAAALLDIKANPLFVPAAPLAAFRKPGAMAPLSAFSHQAWVRGVTGTEVSSVSFTAAHAQTMRPDFGDLRLVDAQGLQWPYVLRETTATMPLRLTPVESARAGASEWTFVLQGRARSLSLVPPPGAPFFSREASLSFAREGQRRQQLWSGWLTSNPAERGAPSSLLVPLEGVPLGEGTFTLEIDDGGDAPLEGLALEAVVVVPQLTAVLAAGDYRALWGAPAQKAPRYDLERVSEVLAELRTTPRPAEAPEANAAWVAPSLVERTGGATRWLFWAVLGLAVIVLGGLTVRIARSEPPSP